MQKQTWQWMMIAMIAYLSMAFEVSAQDTLNRHRIGVGISYFMPHLDGQPLPGSISPNRVAPIIRYRYGKEDGWFVQAQWRGTRGKWPMGKPANFNVSKLYRGMQFIAGVGRYWHLKKNWYAITVLDGSWDRYRSEGYYGGGFTGQYTDYNTRGNMMGAGLSGGLEYRLNSRFRISVDTRFTLGARAQVFDAINPFSSSNQGISESSFKWFVYWIPVQGLMVSYRL
jgi:hypothetical protein